jgi:Tol biopolymer transport system component
MSMFSFSDHKSIPLVQTPFNEADGAVSPDGRWLAYESNETGRWEVYVTTFPPSGTKLSVTTERGVDSLWSSDGSKIFYANPVTGDLWSVDVKPGNPPEFRAHRRIYAGSLDYSSAHSFSIDTKLQRVLVQSPPSPKVEIGILLNWQSSIKN